MRKKIYIPLIIALVSIICLSCKDDEPVSQTNSFLYNSKTRSLENGYLVDYGANGDNTFRDYDVFLFSKGITFNPSGVGSVFIGTGDGINLEFNSPSVDELAPGEYQWDYFSGIPSTLTFGRTYLNFNATTHASGEFIDATDGSATVEKNGDQYTITFTLTINGKLLKGHFSGNLQPI